MTHQLKRAAELATNAFRNKNGELIGVTSAELRNAFYSEVESISSCNFYANSVYLKCTANPMSACIACSEQTQIKDK
jgi:hypothetical protein